MRFIIIGGYAASLRGSPVVTFDADIAPDPERANLRRLCAGLEELKARLRTSDDPAGVEFTCDEHFVSQMVMLNLVTDHGHFDLSFRPAGFPNGYADLVERAEPFDIGGFVVQVAALDDIIESKELLGRPKDQYALVHLYALRDEIAAREKRERDGG